MPSKQFADFWTFIGLLSDNGVLEHVLIIGSWAEYIYDLAGMLPGFDSNLRTLDIDLLVTNLRLPNPPISIPKLAIEAGYTIDTDRLSGATMIYTPGFMEIEFIILSRGSGSSNVLKTNLGVNAHALRHLQVLKDNALEVDIFGINLAVPAPEAYVLHKMIINKQRGSKSLKDQHVIHKLLPIVDKVKLLGIYREMTKKEQRAVSLYCKEHGYQLLD